MIISSVRVNNHRRAFEVATAEGTWFFPYAKASPRPDPQDPVVSAYVDVELGCEAFTFTLASGAEGSVHVE